MRGVRALYTQQTIQSIIPTRVSNVNYMTVYGLHACTKKCSIVDEYVLRNYMYFQVHVCYPPGGETVHVYVVFHQRAPFQADSCLSVSSVTQNMLSKYRHIIFNTSCYVCDVYTYNIFMSCGFRVGYLRCASFVMCAWYNIHIKQKD